MSIKDQFKTQIAPFFEKLEEKTYVMPNLLKPTFQRPVSYRVMF